MTYAKLPGLTWDGTVRERGDGHAGGPAAHRRLAHRPRTCHGGAAQRLICSAAGSPVLMRRRRRATSSARCCRMMAPSGWSRWISPATPPAASEPLAVLRPADNAV